MTDTDALQELLKIIGPIGTFTGPDDQYALAALVIEPAMNYLRQHTEHDVALITVRLHLWNCTIYPSSHRGGITFSAPTPIAALLAAAEAVKKEKT